LKQSKKVVDVKRSVSGYEWSADRQSLMDIYRGLIRMTIDWFMVYGTTAKTWLQRLDGIQYIALRICIGAFKSTSVCALLVESGEMPLDIQYQSCLDTYSFKGFSLFLLFSTL
jgi:hypothetical protein